MPGSSRIELSSTLPTVAPTSGGRTTRPCSMPGTLTLWTNSNWPVTMSRMSTRGTGSAENGPLARVFAPGSLIELQIEALSTDQIAVRHVS